MDGSQYIRVLYWRDASFNTLGFVLERCISQYIGVLYWRDASFFILDGCIGEIHLSVELY